MQTQKKIVVFTGAGISADSGIQTFRHSNGLWANFKIEDVCSPHALLYNRNQVIAFYNERRKEVLSKKPNLAHMALAALQKKYPLHIITQNIDDLHERSGTQNILHLHGEITKLSSSINPQETVPIAGWEQDINARHSDGSLLRPFVVFFGEAVPVMQQAIAIAKQAHIFVIIGTSMAVYPAASLVAYLQKNVPIYIVDPAEIQIKNLPNPIHHIKEKAAIGIAQLIAILEKEMNHYPPPSSSFRASKTAILSGFLVAIKYQDSTKLARS